MRAPGMPARGMWVALVIAALGGCASTPQATPERDAEARQFIPNSGAATIYVYRPDFPAAGENDPVLYVGGRLIGTVLPGSFFRFYVRTGTHVLGGFAHDIGSLKVETRSGELYFVSLNAIAGQSHFALVSPASGKRGIARCCALMENWAPGQRPLPLLR